MLVKIDDIIVNERVRKDAGDIESLKASLQKYGLLNPITINGKNELIAGGRRLMAAKELGWTNINAVVMDNLSEVEMLELEIEENCQRKEFTSDELVDGYDKLEKLRHPSFWTRILKALKKFFSGIASIFKKNKK